MAKDPAFLFYPGDWLGGTLGMSLEQKGAYMELLVAQFNRGRLPETLINHLIGGHWELLKSKFTQDDDGLWFNQRLESEMIKRKSYTTNRRDSFDVNNNDQVHIYLLRAGDTDVYKIGSSKHPTLRLNDVKKKVPSATFFWQTPTLHNRSHEHMLHEKYAQLRVQGDWFALKKENLKEIYDYFSTLSVRRIRTENENENINTVKKVINKVEIPSKEDFLTYCKEFIGKNFSLFAEAMSAKYDTWLEDGWKDGNGKPIVNWKTKARTAKTYMRPDYTKSSHGRRHIGADQQIDPVTDPSKFKIT